MADLILAEIEIRQDEERRGPGRLTGTLVTYGERAADRPELFELGALEWPEAGILINEQHNRQANILRVVPYLDGDAVRIDGLVPDTQRGRDAVTNIREGVYGGLSVEFRALRDSVAGGLRRIQRAMLTGAALVDMGSYRGSTVEVRERGLRRRYWL